MKPRTTVIVFLLLCLSAVPLLSQIVEEDLSPNQDLIKKKFDEAVSKFNSLDQASSIYDFNEIIVVLEAAFKDKTIEPSMMLYLKRSYDFRAQIYFNMGEEAKAGGDILSILDLDMDYQPPREASVKYLKLFDLLKSKMTGFFQIITNPSEAKIYLNDKMIGYSNTPIMRYKIGTYTLRSVVDGYKTDERTIEINSGKTTKTVVDLDRIAAALLLQTSPSGVEVYLDGKYYGTTDGTAGEGDVSRLKTLGIDPAKCSAVLKIPNLPLGKHKLELKKSCYQESVVALDFQQPEDYTLNPIVLTTSQGEVVLQDTPPEADVFLNGQLQGKGNISLKNLCSGQYTLTIKFSDGKYLKQFNLKKDETVYVSPSKKPTLLFGGLMNTGEGVSWDTPLAIKFSGLLDTLQTLNVYTPTVKERNEDKELLTTMMKIADNLEGIAVEPGIVLDPVTSETKKELLSKYGADLLLFFVQTDESEYSMVLFHSSHGTADVVSFNYDDTSGNNTSDIEKAVQRLDIVPELQSSWFGFSIVEPVSGEGLNIIEVRAQSPAAKAGLTAGDRLLFMATRRMTDMARYYEVLKQIKPGQDVSIKIERNGVPMDLSIKAGTTLETPRKRYGVYYLNRLLAEIISGKAADLLPDKDVTIPYMKAVLYYYLAAIESGQKLMSAVKDKKSDSMDPGLIELFSSLLASKAGDLQTAGAEREKMNKYPDSRIYDKNGFPFLLMGKYGIYP